MVIVKKLEQVTDKLLDKTKKILNFIYKYRFVIALILFCLCVFFEISGSSIGYWNTYVNSGGAVEEGVLFGKSREIRSDEWAVLTPMIFSQSFDGFKYFSNLIRGGMTDVFMIYGLPTMNLMQIFRPFLLGFLFLGNSRGLSFFWVGRLIALFLVSLEFGMILTKKNKLLSCVYAFMISLSPLVQWWFAVNGIAEIFIFGQLALILLYKYLNTEKLKIRIVYLLFMIICAGGYVLVLYPAWQIPMFYIFLILAIWEIVENRKNCKIDYKDIISIVIAVMIFASCMIYILNNSLDTIKSVISTEYPGSRVSTGGEKLEFYFKYVIDIFLPTKDLFLKRNVCSTATMFTLFPMGLILSGIVLFKEKKKDLPLIMMLCLYIFFSIFCIIGLPEVISKITLLSFSTSSRMLLAVGFLDILILIRAITIVDKSLTFIPSFVLSAILSIVLVVINKYVETEYITTNMAIAMIIMLTYLFYFLFRNKQKYSQELFSIGIIFVMIMAGGMVNPIRKGIDVIYDSPVMKEIQKIGKENKGKWIVEEMPFPYPNYVLMAGVPVINSTNTYPDIEKWEKLDNQKQYEEVYNRYSHIRINLVADEEEYKNKFELMSLDAFSVNLLPDELQKLDVKYIFSSNNFLEDLKTENTVFKMLTSLNGYYIYEVSYK